MSASGQLMVVCASHSPAMTRDREQAQGPRFRAGLDVARSLIAEFDPELLVVFGSDHRRAFREVVPAFCVPSGAEGYGDMGSPAGRYDVPEELAAAMAAAALAAGFDIATSPGIRLDHGFGLTVEQLFGRLDALPVLPVFVNCASPPLAPVRRVFAFGEWVGQFVRQRAGRVLVIGSGGLSHSPPSLEAGTAGLSDEQRRELNRKGMPRARTRIDPGWDRAFLDALARADWPAVAGLSDAEIDVAGVGAHEIRTWVAACAAGGGPVATVAYEAVPDWITGMGVAVSAGRMSS
jgi:2,3-dihydroxyphenylpropionate 1,2-dioxygenase